MWAVRIPTTSKVEVIYVFFADERAFDAQAVLSFITGSAQVEKTSSACVLREVGKAAVDLTFPVAAHRIHGVQNSSVVGEMVKSGEWSRRLYIV